MILNFIDVTSQLIQYARENENELRNSYKDLIEIGVNQYSFKKDTILKHTWNASVNSPLDIFNGTPFYNGSFQQAEFIENMIQESQKNTLLIALTSYPELKHKTVRLFGVYVDPQLRKRLKNNSSEKVNLHIFMHPGVSPELSEHNKGYINFQKISPYFIDLAYRYMFSPKGLIESHYHLNQYNFFSFTQSSDTKPMILIFPLFSKEAYRNFLSKPKNETNIAENSIERYPIIKNKDKYDLKENLIKRNLEVPFFNVIQELVKFVCGNIYQNKIVKDISAIAISGYSE